MVLVVAPLYVDCLRGHLGEIKYLVIDLGMHILALNETKLDPAYPKEITGVSGYKQVHHERAF